MSQLPVDIANSSPSPLYAPFTGSKEGSLLASSVGDMTALGPNVAQFMVSTSPSTVPATLHHHPSGVISSQHLPSTPSSTRLLSHVSPTPSNS